MADSLSGSLMSELPRPMALATKPPRKAENSVLVISAVTSTFPARSEMWHRASASVRRPAGVLLVAVAKARSVIIIGTSRNSD